MARRSPSRRTPRTADVPAQPSARASQRPPGALGFLLRFVAMVAVFYVLTFVPTFREKLFPAYLRTLASISATALPPLEPDVTAAGSAIMSPRFAIDIRAGCDALEPMALLVAGVFAAPVRWRLRLIGAAAGVGLLFVANIARIVGLFIAGVHAPRTFQFLHLDVGQALFVFLAVLIWLAWAMWAVRRSPELRHGDG